MRDGPLDMRMDTTRGPTVADWLAQASVDEMREVIADYGEERFAFQVAKAIAARRATRPLRTTLELAECVASAVRTRERAASGHTHLQALRIYINRELEELARTLASALDLLAPGRLAVISFHSLEDRMVAMHRGGGQAGRRVCIACPCAKAKCPSPCCIPLAASRPRTMKWRSMPRPFRRAARGRTQRHAAAGRRRSRLRAYGFLARQRPRRSAQGRKGRAPLMGRVNLIIAALLMLSAISLVTSRYQSRQLFVELGRIRRRSATWRSAGGGCSWSAPSWRVTRAWMPLRAIASR